MSVLTRITTRAKQLYKKGKAGISWVAAIKRASVQVKGKAAPKRKRARTVKRRRRAVGKGPTIAPTRKYVAVPQIMGIGRVKRRSSKRSTAARKTKSVGARYRAEIKSKLAAALLSYDLADTVKATKAAQKRKVKYRKILKAL